MRMRAIEFQRWFIIFTSFRLSTNCIMYVKIGN